MKILIALTYYRPHVSGLTVYVERLARALVGRGHEVTVLTSQYAPTLPREELSAGMRVVRVPVAFRISKGVIMPAIGVEAWRQVMANDVLSLHLPQLDAAGIALRGWLLRKPTVLTYHCDLLLPRGLINVAANTAAHLANRMAAGFAHRVVAYTEDYAVHSPFLSRYLHKLEVISPPVEVAEVTPRQVEEFARAHRKRSGPAIGIAVRLATEKGVEHLLAALPIILERHPDAEVLFAGQYKNVLGEEEYARKLAPLFDRYADHWTFLGVLEPQDMASFFHACDVTVLPSVNSTESFGLVQIESMLCATPVVASDLPGVRQPVLTTGMGRIAPVGDAPALAGAILDVLAKRDTMHRDAGSIAERYAPQHTAQQYEELFIRLQAELGKASGR
jgi:glycosyltransferase involved in cell wall biosynthesis